MQGCARDKQRNNWRCTRAVRTLCENAPLPQHVSMPARQSNELKVVAMTIRLCHRGYMRVLYPLLMAPACQKITT